MLLTKSREIVANSPDTVGNSRTQIQISSALEEKVRQPVKKYCHWLEMSFDWESVERSFCLSGTYPSKVHN